MVDTYSLHILHLNETHLNDFVQFEERFHALSFCLFNQRHIHGFGHCYPMMFFHLRVGFVQPVLDHLFQCICGIFSSLWITKIAASFPHFIHTVNCKGINMRTDLVVGCSLSENLHGHERFRQAFLDKLTDMSHRIRQERSRTTRIEQPHGCRAKGSH